MDHLKGVQGHKYNGLSVSLETDPAKNEDYLIAREAKLRNAQFSQQQNNQPNHSSGVPGSNTTGGSRCPESLGNTSSTAWTVKSELNGNVGDLMPRGDPLMGSFTNSILPANNDFDL